jgi:signal transduction histidine kinase
VSFTLSRSKEIAAKNRAFLQFDQQMTKKRMHNSGDQNDLEARFSELTGLSSDILDLFYTQTFQPGSINSPTQVCEAFSEILGRHWRLCCLSIFLRSEDGVLEEVASHSSQERNGSKAVKIPALIAREVERTGGEVLVWQSDKQVHSDLESAVLGAGLAGCIGVPIFARGMLVGVLVVLSADGDRLRSALSGIRFIAAPVVIAVGNVRRTAAMQQQHKRIEQLVADLREHGEALEEANRELRRVAQYRSMFLARMSHELRTPLTSILGFAEILLDHEDLTEIQRRFCEKIQSSGTQLQISLNHLVDLSRLEAGQSELFLHEFSIREALRESCAAVARLAEKRGVEVECDLPDIPSVVSDEGKLRQVLYNFLAHAISRSSSGSTVKVSGKFLPGGRFKVDIEDCGEAVADFSKLFEPVDITLPTDKSANINELGLVIAKRLIDVLDGEVHLKDSDSGGLLVSLEFPTRPSN